MKKFIQRTAIVSAIILAFSLAGSAQIVVRIRPKHERVIVAPPPAPSPHHVWIEGGWTARGGRYEWRDGYWAEPRRGYHRYSQGHWVRRRSGWIWIEGRWSR